MDFREMRSVAWRTIAEFLGITEPTDVLTGATSLKYLAGDGTWKTTPLGSVTSVAETFTGGIISVAGSPITASGTLALTVAGTSGGVPYFSSGTAWASSGALAQGGIVVGGGAGASPASVTAGATTEILVGGGANTAPVWTTASGSGAPVRATSPALTTPSLGVASATSINFGQDALNYYDEGTWTPADGSGGGLSITVNSATFTRVGRLVTTVANIDYPANASGAGAAISGFPFSAGIANDGGGPSVMYTTYGATRLAGLINGTTLSWYNGTSVAVTNISLASVNIRFHCVYFA